MISFAKKALIYFGFAVALTGCSILSVDKSPEKVVEQRSQARIDLLIKGESEKAWRYTTPTFRQRIAAKNYQLIVAGAVNWRKGVVRSVSCEAERCEVLITLTHYMPEFKQVSEMPLREVWIHTEGNWWIYHRR